MAEPEFLSPADRHVTSRLGELTPDDFAVAPPPASVWQGIAAGLVSEPVATPTGRHRRLPRVALGIGAAAAVAVAIVGVALTSRRADDMVITEAATLSSDGLPGAPPGRQATARVLDERGRRVLEVDLGDTRPASGEYLELWLIKPDISGMVSLGAVRPDGTYDLPAGLQVDDYPVVDVSTEPYDGNPAHSGLSLLRGVLDRTT